jgi:hypothetical protein
MKTAHRSVFVRADLRAHLFGFMLTSPDKHACSCLDRIHPVSWRVFRFFSSFIIIKNFGTLDGGIDKHREADQRHRLARFAGRVIEKPFVSVTIDVLMRVRGRT